MIHQVLICVCVGRRIITIKVTHHRGAGPGVFEWVDDPVGHPPLVYRFPSLLYYCITMDPFQFFAPAENARAVLREAISPERAEMRQLLTRLRSRYGRRRVFRVRDVEEVVMQIRYPDLYPERLAPPTPRRSTPRTVARVQVDLTEVDRVIE